MNPSSLSAVFMIYHQQSGESPTAVDGRWSRGMEGDEQPYSRKVVLGEDWQPIDCGWCKDGAGYVVIENLEGKNLQAQPTPEERRAISERVVEIGFGENPAACLFVLPGESHPLSPTDASEIVLRCRKGKAKATVTVYPR